jgi:hypothetical protein
MSSLPDGELRAGLLRLQFVQQMKTAVQFPRV